MNFIEFKDVTINLDRVLFFRRDESRIYATFQGKEESPVIIYVGEHVVDAHNLLMYLINRSKGEV